MIRDFLLADSIELAGESHEILFKLLIRLQLAAGFTAAAVV